MIDRLNDSIVTIAVNRCNKQIGIPVIPAPGKGVYVVPGYDFRYFRIVFAINKFFNIIAKQLQFFFNFLLYVLEILAVSRSDVGEHAYGRLNYLSQLLHLVRTGYSGLKQGYVV